MESKYLQELFRFTCGHINFPDGIKGLFTMEPTEQGQKTLNGYKLNFKKLDDGFAIIAPCLQQDATGFALEKPFTGNEKLSFAVFANDPLFFDYSELPYDPPGEYVYYFNNLDATKRRTSLLLHVEGIKESEKIQLHTKTFSFTMKSGAIPVVRDCRGTTIQATQYDCSSDTIKNLYIVDLSRLDDGVYTIEYNNTTMTCYCTKASFIRKIPLLIIEFFVDTTVPQEYQIINRINNIQYISPKNFGLHFGIYDMYWKYKIIPVRASTSAWIKILTNGTAFIPEKIKVNAAYDPMLFTSDNTINQTNTLFKALLYREHWKSYEKCSWNPKYYYCNQSWGILIDGVFKCRNYTTKDGVKIYKYSCPAVHTDELIGELPKPDIKTATYYHDGDKYIAEIVVYLIYQDGKYYISTTKTIPDADGLDCDDYDYSCD
jgi:hypothetical protein